MRSASPLPGHFTSTIRTTGAGTSVDADVAAGLEQDLVPGVEQPRHQRDSLLLQQWLAAGELDQRARQALDPRQHVVDAPSSGRR